MATAETKTIQKTTEQTVVVKADQAQNFKLEIPRTAVGHIDIVDVDIVLTLKNGQKVVLAEGAIDAIGGGQASIHFSDTALSLQDAVKDVGEVKIDANTPQVGSNASDSNTTQSTPVAEAQRHPNIVVDAPDTAAVVADPSGASLGKMVQEGVSNQPPQVVKLDLNTKAGESDSSFDVPPAAPSVNNPPAKFVTVTNAIPLQFSLLAQTGESVVAGVRYGSYGATGADAISTIAMQAAPQIISDVAVGETVQANVQAGVSFIKLLHIEYTGGATPSALVLTGLPADVTIPGLVRAADGSYSINLSTMANTLGAGQYDIPLQYLVQGVNASNPVHESFRVTANLIGDIAGTVENVAVSVAVVIKDVSQASDLNYIDPSTGVSALVLPAQGIGYDITAAGNNHITGGSSNDIIYSGTGNNVLDGAAGVNTLSYSNAASGQVINLQTGLVTGSAGNDTVSNFQIVVGSAGSDNITGASSTLSMSGGSGGDDTFDGGHGGVVGAAGTITGSATGNNTLTFVNETVAGAAGGVIVNLATGAVSGAYGVEVVSNIQNVIGGSGNDFLTGGSSTKTLSGGAGGNDTFDGGGGNVTVTGSSSGTNTLTFAQASGPVTVDLQTGTATGYGTETLTHIQSVIGSSYADLIVAAADSSVISGGAAGNDTIDASQTAAVISGSATGNNVLTFANDVNAVNVNLQLQYYDGGYGAGSASNIQNVVGSTHNDVLIGALNTRSISGDGGNDVFDGGGGGSVSTPEQIIGGATGTNTLTFAAAGQGVNVDLQAGTATGYGVQHITNVQKIIGSAYNDTIVGALTTLSLSGGQGGIDLFDGGGGNETITGSSSGDNTVTYANAKNGVVVDLGSGVATGYGNETLIAIQRITGSNFADNLTGTSTTALLSGGAGGADTFNPGGGGTVTAQETIAGSSSGNNTVTYATATSGVTVNLATGLATGYGNQILSNIQNVVGSSLSDTLTGTTTTLSLSGGTGGNDTFDGGGGNVTIAGSSTGNNTVMFANDTAGAVTVNLKTGTVTGAYGNETLSNIQNIVGSSFADTLTAGATTRSLSGGAGGDDTFDGGGANVTIAGSTTGSNTLTFANDTASGVSVNLQTGSVTGGYGTETVSNIQRVIGSSFADTLTGTATTVSLSGGTGGADTFNPGGGGTVTAQETIAGSSSGNNTVTYATATSGVTVNLATGLATGYGNQTLSNIQKVTGSSFADTLTGTTTTLSLSGGAGGNDTFDAGSGGTSTAQETITGGTGGVNTLTYAGVAAGATTRSLSGGAGGDDTFDGGGANVTIAGSTTGSNTLTFANDTVSAVSVNLQTGSVTGGYGTETVSNIQRVIGSSFADTLTGTATTVSLSGGTGGADTFSPGGGGSAAVQETILGSTSGQNTISYAGAAAGVTVNLATGLATGFGFQTISNIQKVIGSGFSDTLTGSATTLSLSGGAGGDDTFSPGAGGTSTVQESITGSSTGNNTVTYAGAAAVVVNMQTNRVTGSGFQTLANIQNVIGSANADTFLASATTKSFDGGSGGNDTFDGGGFGTASAPLLISGSVTGVNTLTFASSTGGVNVNLQTGAVTGAYGVETISRIQQVIGSKFADTITGVASGNATIDGGGGADNIIGGAGNNTLTFAKAGAGGVVVNLQSGIATGYGTGTETISGAIQNVIGSAGNDVLTAGTGTLSLNGGSAGNDTFDGSAQGTAATPLLLTGSASGSNTVTFSHATGAVNVNLQSGVVTGAYGVETLSLIRTVIGSTFGDTITGVTSGNATIDAGGGADNIIGGAGNNTLTYANAGAGGVVVNLQTGLATGYGSGTETISGAIQNVIGSAGADFMTAGAGTLSLSGGTAGNDTFDGGGVGTAAAPLVIAGSSSGTGNTLTFAAATGGVTANLNTGSVTGAYGVETVSRIQSVIGSAYADVITGSATATSLNGGAGGNDTFDGGGGNVVITGSTSGFNTLTFANDTAGGVVVNLQTHLVTGAYGNETVTNIHNVIGSSFSDVLTGTTTTLSLNGGTGGNDTFDGGGGGTVAAPLVITGSTTGTNVLTFAHDTIAGDPGAVNVNFLTHAVTGGYGIETVTNIHNVIGSVSGNDVIVGDNFGDSLTAGNGNVSITGGTGNDTIIGGTGSDTLFGGAGNDILTAGAGVVNITGGSGNDTINAALATGGAILGGVGRAATDQDLAIVGSAFNTAMQTNAANNHIDLGGGVNTLQLNWQSAATTSYNFSTVSAAIRDVSTIDLTHNTAASSVTYTISAADIIAMTPAASVNLKLSSGDFLNVALTAGQTVAIGGGGATEVVKDASANIIATIHLT